MKRCARHELTLGQKMKVNSRIQKIALIFGLLAVVNTAMADGDATKGKKIFADSQCTKCHQTDELFTREDRKVKSLEQLDSQVRSCDARLSTNLYDDEVEDVVAYLNEAYYHFEIMKTEEGDKGTEKETDEDKEKSMEPLLDQ